MKQNSDSSIKLNKALVGIAGVAKSGKDTACQLIIDIAKSVGLTAQRFALADELKIALRPTLINTYGIDIMKCTPEEKEKVRPELVEYGKQLREKTNGKFWTDILHSKIAESSCELAIVSDIRYCSYDEDEVQWLKKLGGALIHVTRHENGRLIPPPNQDEKENDPKLIALSDIDIVWPTAPRETLHNDYYQSFMSAIQLAQHNARNR